MEAVTDLHTHLRTVIEERLAVARAATPGPWDHQATSLYMDGSGQYRIAPVGKPQVLSSYMHGADPEFIALHDPADAVRRYEVDLRRLERHKPYWFAAGPTVCDGDHSGQNSLWPCDEIRDLAASLGIEVDG